MKTAIIAIIVIIFAGVNEAGAKRPHVPTGKRSAHVATQARAGASHAAQDARPAKWCGWFARKDFTWRDPGPEFNQARKWAKWGSPAFGPAPGVVVVYPHHVAKIVGRDSDGQWIMRSGNDRNAVRERPRSLKGVIAFRI